MQRVSRSLKIHGDGFLGYLRNSFADRNRTSSNLNYQYLQGRRQRFDSCRVKSYNKKLYQSHSLFNQSQFSSKANLKSRKKINDHRLAVFQKLYCTLFIVYSKRVSSQQASFLLIFLFQWEESYEGRQQWMICSYGDTKGLRFVSNLLLIVLHFASRRECNQKPSSKTIQIGFN